MDAVGAIVTSKPLDTAALIEALRAEALRRSRNQVKALLKSQGVKLQEFRAADITREAKLWLEGHRQELVGQALGDLLMARCVNLLTSAPKQNEPKSMGSAVRMLGAK